MYVHVALSAMGFHWGQERGNLHGKHPKNNKKGKKEKKRKGNSLLSAPKSSRERGLQGGGEVVTVSLI